MGITPPARLIVDRAALASALTTCAVEGAAALPVLCEAERMRLVATAENLSWRSARTVVGEDERQVFQDFDLAEDFPDHSPYREVAGLIDAAIAEAARRLSPNPLPEGFHINDLILQRYAPGSRGITPHRDHLRYRGLVALVILSGDGRFCVCDDRRGSGAREISAGPDDLLLMRAPGLAGASERPFHFLDRITVARLSFGLRWDTASASRRD